VAVAPGGPLGAGAVSKIIFRYVVRTYLILLFSILAGLLAIFLVADFVDRAKAYTGPNWVADVTVLYGYKALLAIQQLGPAALMLAAGATVALLRRRGEVTALGSLAFGTDAIYLPAGLCAAVACVLLIGFDESVVVKAGPRVDEITTQRFNRWGDWRMYFVPKHWFRRNDRVFYLRAGDVDRGFDEVTILRLTPEFHLAERIDAERMTYLEGTRWLLTGVSDRTFGEDGSARLDRFQQAAYELGARGDDFRVRIGRPEQMRVGQLRQQIRIRERVGLPTGQFRLAMHNRFAYPLAALPAALLAVGLALRPGRKGHLTSALVEGLAIAIALWATMVICRTLVLAERLSPPVAAWAPVAMLVLASLIVYGRREGRWKLHHR